MRSTSCFFSLVFLLFSYQLPASILPLALMESDSQEAVDSVQVQHAASLLAAYVQIPSVSGNEKPAGEFLAEQCRRRKLHVRVLTDEYNSYNFIASLYPLEEKKPNIVLLNHIDVVPEGDPESWTYPPFSGVMADGFVWGRGAIDNKAMGIMQLLAIASFADLAEENDFPYNVSMLSVSGEETGGEKGAAIVVSDYLELLHPAVVFGEGGTGLRGISQANPEQIFFGISIAQKRGLWIELIASNVSSGHGSVPRENYPAKDMVDLAGRILHQRQRMRLSPPVKEMFRELGRYERGFRKLVLRNIGFFRPLVGNTLRKDPMLNALMTNTITLTNIRGIDGAINQVTPEVRATFDVRLLPETNAVQFLEELRQMAAQNDIQLEVISLSPYGQTSQKGVYYDALKHALTRVYPGAAVSPMMFPAHNDNVFFRKHGVPAYGVLPALLTEDLVESIHAGNERMNKLELYRGVLVYKELIEILIQN